MPTHFSPEAIKFLRGLIKNNDREWFNARKPTYERELKAPMLALIDELNHGMAEFAPDHLRAPNKIMMRIYRDTRFSKNKMPYKRHISAWWVARGMEKTSGAGYYIQIDPTQVQVFAGCYLPEREQLFQIRSWLAEHHEEYRKIFAAALKPKRGIRFTQVDPAALTRMPKGFPGDHPAGELLRANVWAVQESLPASLATEPGLAKEILKRFAAAQPLVDTLNGAIRVAEEGRRKPLKALF